MASRYNSVFSTKAEDFGKDFAKALNEAKSSIEGSVALIAEVEKNKGKYIIFTETKDGAMYYQFNGKDVSKGMKARTVETAISKAKVMGLFENDTPFQKVEHAQDGFTAVTFKESNKSGKALREAKGATSTKGLTRVGSIGFLQDLLKKGVTVTAFGTGPFGEDEGATVISVDPKDIEFDYSDYDTKETAEEYRNSLHVGDVVCLDKHIGQSDANYYALDMYNVGDLDLYYDDNEYDRGNGSPSVSLDSGDIYALSDSVKDIIDRVNLSDKDVETLTNVRAVLAKIARG